MSNFENLSPAPEWPEDTDGDMFRMLYEEGFDFTQPVNIAFNIDFNHWPLTESELLALQAQFPKCEVIEVDDEDTGEVEGYVQIVRESTLNYEFVTSVQRHVSKQVKSLGGWCDSWEVDVANYHNA